MKNEQLFTDEQDELQVNIANAVNNALINGSAEFMFNTSDGKQCFVVAAMNAFNDIAISSFTPGGQRSATG